MRRFIKNYLIAFAFLGGTVSQAFAQDGISPSLRTLKVPAAQTRGLATKLSIQYRDVPSVQIAPDVPNQQLVIMAPIFDDHIVLI